MKARLLVPAFAFVFAPSVLLAQAAPAASVSFGAETVSFGTPVGLFDAARHRVSMAFFAKPPSPEAEAAARRALEWNPDSGGPSVVIDLTFAPESTSGLVQQLKSCNVRFRGFKHAPMDLSGGARECHLVSTGGMLRAGGAMIGLMQGSGTGYSLRLPFSVMFPASVESSRPGAGPAAAPTPDAPTVPANTVAGSASYDGQKLVFSHGIAWWDAEHGQISLAFFDHTPPPGILAELRSGSSGDGGPSMTMDLRFEGSPRPEPAAISYCFVNVDWPKGGSMGNNTDGKGCGVTTLGGDLKAGGSVTAMVKGRAIGPGEKPYSWDLRFNLPIAK